jgi:hypothetical protein
MARKPSVRDFVFAYPNFVAAAYQQLADTPRRIDYSYADHKTDEQFTDIELQVLIDHGDDVVTRSLFYVRIDHKRKMLDDRNTSPSLFGKEWLGSAAVGIMLVSLPLTVPLIPVIWSHNKIWKAREEAAGMNRHFIYMLKKLKGQLPPEIEELLRQTAQNEWRARKHCSRRVTLAEAKEELRQCELAEERAHCKQTGAVLRESHWLNKEGHFIGFGKMRREEEPYVRVCGSKFKGEEALQLFECYNTIKSDDRGEV